MERTINNHAGTELSKSTDILIKPKEACITYILEKQLRKLFIQL